MALIKIPASSLVVLCGPAGCGKSTFARKNFKPTQIVSTDHCRAMVSDDESNISSSYRAFKVFRCIIEQRLALGRLTVADSTALTRKARRELLEMGRAYDFQIIILVFNIPLETCIKRNLSRSRVVSEKVLASHSRQLKKTLEEIKREGFDGIHILDLEEKENTSVHVIPLPLERQDSGPFDIIGDIHGCCDELEMLLDRLGYLKNDNSYAHPSGRKAIFLGDLGDRGPRCLDSINLVIAMVEEGNALYVPGNHCNKLARYLAGRGVKVSHGLENTVREINKLTEWKRTEFSARYLEFFYNAWPYLILDGGKLVVSHAGITGKMIGKLSGRIREFCMYGDTTGQLTTEGLPVRRDWARNYRGKALVVYGHVPVPEAEFRNNTIDIDQGCAIGGKLTALRYPERELVQLQALDRYYSRGIFRNLASLPGPGEDQHPSLTPSADA